MCPMRFNKFPLDEHSCKFVVGSTNYDDTRMTFANDKLEYDPSAGNTILDYQVLFKCKLVNPQFMQSLLPGMKKTRS